MRLAATGSAVTATRTASDRLANGSSVDLHRHLPARHVVTGGDAGAFDELNGAHVGNQVVRNASMAGADGYTAHFDNALTNGNDAQIFVDASCANANQVVLKSTAASRKSSGHPESRARLAHCGECRDGRRDHNGRVESARGPAAA